MWCSAFHAPAHPHRCLHAPGAQPRLRARTARSQQHTSSAVSTRNPPLQHRCRRRVRAAAGAAAAAGDNWPGPPPPPPPGGGRRTAGGGGEEESSPAGPGTPSSSSSSNIGHILAAAAGCFILLGLLQPWRVLSQLPGIDTSQQAVSIIVPVLNEAASIVHTLECVRQLQPPAAEVIVVDGGSTDRTVSAARRSGLADKVLRSGKGRAVQMNAGADAASGELLCFLHADTTPPRDLVSVMRRELRDSQTVLAGFVPSIEVPGRRLWLLSFHNFISTYYAPLLFRPLSYLRGLRGLFGDQTMFCRRCDFKAVGGFDTRWRIMEDTDLCVRMHDAGPCRHHAQQQQQHQRAHPQSTRGRGGMPTAAAATSTASVPGWCQRWQQWWAPRGRVKMVLTRQSVTSGRRLEAWGPLRATYIHMVIGTAWYFQRDPEQLRKLYERLYTDAYR